MTNRFLTILFLIFSFSYSTDAQEADKNGFLVQVGDIAPYFTAELTDGTSFDLQAQRGKVVMLQFTASWCGVCRREMPYIEKDIWEKLKGEKFVLIGVDRDEPLDVVKAYSAKVGISYPLALDPDAEIFSLYAELLSGVTRNVIIDEQGKIIYMTRLFQLDEFNTMTDFIFKAVAKLQ